MTEKCGIRTHSEIYKTGSREYSQLFMGSTLFAGRYSVGFYVRYGRFLPPIRDSLDLEYLKRFFKVKNGIQMNESKIHFCFVYHNVLINRRSLLCSLVMQKTEVYNNKLIKKEAWQSKTYKLFCDKGVWQFLKEYICSVRSIVSKDRT